jgi:hypothetical protein
MNSVVVVNEASFPSFVLDQSHYLHFCCGMFVLNWGWKTSTIWHIRSSRPVRYSVVRFGSTDRANTTNNLANRWGNTKHSCNQCRTWVDGYRHRTDSGRVDDYNRSIHHSHTWGIEWCRTTRMHR